LERRGFAATSDVDLSVTFASSNSGGFTILQTAVAAASQFFLVLQGREEGSTPDYAVFTFNNLANIFATNGTLTGSFALTGGTASRHR
jgi:hypothetical protein